MRKENLLCCNFGRQVEEFLFCRDDESSTFVVGNVEIVGEENIEKEDIVSYN